MKSNPNWWREYIVPDAKKYNIKPVSGGKDINQMSKQAKVEPVSKATTTKKYQKSAREQRKDILIAVLITAVIAFVGGMIFANKQEAEIKAAVSAAQVTAKK